MDNKNKTNQYVEHINEYILPFINYTALQASYYTRDMAYAKGVLNHLHEAMVKIYGSENLSEEDGDDGFVVIPGIVRGKDTGNICLVLLDIDLSSSGEHWGTAFICEHGVISQNNIGKDPAVRKVLDAIGHYDYCYTAKIYDIHVSHSRLPNELKNFLSDFRNHNKLFSPGNIKLEKQKKVSKTPADDIQGVTEKSSVVDKIRESGKTSKTPKKDKSPRKKQTPEL
jgi:hypothetical protein